MAPIPFLSTSYHAIQRMSAMGTAWYIALEQKIPGFDELLVDGKSLAHATDELDNIARRREVTPLMEFFGAGADEIMDLLSEDGFEGMEGLEPRWFAPSDGLKTTEALLNHIQADPTSVPRADFVLEDLRNFEKVLKRANTEGIRWHLAIDI
jgi:hypothetical protein